MPPKLIDNRSNKEIELKEFPFSVGRSGCHWNIPTDGIAEKHLTFYLEGGKYFIEDKGSQTGTYLDNRLVEKKTQIRDGQRLKIAVTEKWPAGVKDLTFKVEDDEDKISLEDLDILQEEEVDKEGEKIEARHFVCHITSKGFLKGGPKIRVPLEKLTKERIRFWSVFSYKKAEKLLVELTHPYLDPKVIQMEVVVDACLPQENREYVVIDALLSKLDPQSNQLVVSRIQLDG